MRAAGQQLLQQARHLKRAAGLRGSLRAQEGAQGQRKLGHGERHDEGGSAAVLPHVLVAEAGSTRLMCSLHRHKM